MADRSVYPPRQGSGISARVDNDVEKAFGTFVAYERPRRISSLACAIDEVVHQYCGEYLVSQPVRIDKDHPFFGQAARCGEILTGCDAKDVVRFEIDPSKEGQWKDGEIPTVVVMVGTRDQRWHEARDITVDRLVGAWLDARR